MSDRAVFTVLVLEPPNRDQGRVALATDDPSKALEDPSHYHPSATFEVRKWVNSELRTIWNWHRLDKIWYVVWRKKEVPINYLRISFSTCTTVETQDEKEAFQFLDPKPQLRDVVYAYSDGQLLGMYIWDGSGTWFEERLSRD